MKCKVGSGRFGVIGVIAVPKEHPSATSEAHRCRYRQRNLHSHTRIRRTRHGCRAATCHEPSA
jgi:hypothetical protein